MPQVSRNNEQGACASAETEKNAAKAYAGVSRFCQDHVVQSQSPTIVHAAGLTDCLPLVESFYLQL